ncbi:KdsC family phosphatase [Pseudodesulfovibrio senegalensis]|uniref:HAD hydrolase family protein n=1 Tax=Pseudodesulfovibrio senegalensis TaxID=1721087 RepID=A0A6N6N0G5_9BACT|nr:HAD hydrolase family protein [Pseudodesulfovibrio senegalensis]KAB1440868.1 HAD hydrolase family protein [Pseudodesulfovibrio senegalensis]
MQNTKKLKDVELVVYDFDGVMTDNRVLVGEDGTEAVFCNRGDGHGVGIMRSLGLEQAILSTETNPVVAARAEKLGIPAVHGCADKGQGLRELARERGVDLSKILFVGNDTNDLPAFRLAGVLAAPSDAHPEILGMAHLVTSARGGHGVVRELADMFLAVLK